MDVFVGIDGGGSRATAVATDVEGRELARVEGGPGRIRLDAPGTGAHVLADLVDHVIREAGARLPAAGLICALAGAGREDARRELAAALLREAVAIRLRVVTDAEAAYQDAFGGGPGILLIAGTGSIAWGRDADGRTIRAGGWGALLGDEGSGYDLGLRALRAVLHAHDGRGPATGLTGTIGPEVAHWSNPDTKGGDFRFHIVTFEAFEHDDAAVDTRAAGAAEGTGVDGAAGPGGHALPEVVLNREHSDYMWATRE